MDPFIDMVAILISIDLRDIMGFSKLYVFAF